MTNSALICDADLHSYLLGPEVAATVNELQNLVAGVLRPEVKANSVAVLERACGFGSDEWEEEAQNAFNTCPHNLAERCLEAMGIYYAVGSSALPELVRLSREILHVDLHEHFQPAGRPYRDHLAHQTRVAALAHLFFSGIPAATGEPNAVPLSPGNALESLLSLLAKKRLQNYNESREHAWLVKHLLGLGLDSGFLSKSKSEEHRPLVRAAALLAGLVHDLGYTLRVSAKVGGSPRRGLRRLGVYPEAGAADPPRTPLTELYRLVFANSGVDGAFPTLQDYVLAHPITPHSLAGAMWLTYLPERLLGSGLTLHRFQEPKLWGKLEYVAQLAALMALAHDFPFESKKRQGEQGFDPPKGLEKELPLCSVFALADILHEFGRPIIFTGAREARAIAPVRGILLSYPDRLSSLKEDQRDALVEFRLLSSERRKKLKKFSESPPVEVFWVLDDNYSRPAAGPPLWSTFNERLLGEDVLARLEGWGLDEIVGQRDVGLAAKAEEAGRLTKAEVATLGLGESRLPTGGQLAIYPLVTYDESVSRVRRDGYRLRPLA